MATAWLSEGYRLVRPVKAVSGIPQIGFGTWLKKGETGRSAVLWALEAGYRHIDTAQGYDNEEIVGQAIAEFAAPRDQVFITTKVRPENLGPGALRPSVETSLKKLRVEQVDLALIHWPSNQVPLGIYLEQLVAIRDSGLTRMIGVSNFTIALLREGVALLGQGQLATNQIEVHAFFKNRSLRRFCAEIGVPVTAYCPLAQGGVAGHPVLTEIGARHGAGADQVALAYLLAQGLVVIPSSGKRERIISNLGAIDIVLSDDDIAAIEALDDGVRLIRPDWAPDWD